MTTGTREMLTAIYCRDKGGDHIQALRMQYLQEHLDYISGLVDNIFVAGPLFGDDGKTVVGSLLIYKTVDKAQARHWLEADPYFKADIWESIEIETFLGAIGEAVGGIAF